MDVPYIKLFHSNYFVQEKYVAENRQMERNVKTDVQKRSSSYLLLVACASHVREYKMKHIESKKKKKKMKHQECAFKTIYQLN